MFKAGTSKKSGDRAETLALQFLSRQGLHLVERNYRVAGGPHARGGEVDLILRAKDGTLIFVEVRSRSSVEHGGAAASVTLAKQRRLVFAAQHYLMRWASPPPCRFDVVAVQGNVIEWLPAAFDTQGVS